MNRIAAPATAAYTAASVLAVGVALCIWGIPLSLSDFTAVLLDAEPLSFTELFVERSQTPGNFRPLYWVHMKALYEVADGRYLATFKLAHAAQLLVTVWLAVRLLQVRSATGFVVSLITVMALLASHTMLNVHREGPMTSILFVLLALTLAFGERQSPWRDAAAVLVLVAAMLFVELGLLVWVIVAVGWLLGLRGVSGKGVAACTVAVCGYLAYRFLVLNPGGGGIQIRETGFGFGTLEDPGMLPLVGGLPLVLYAYNMVCAALTVLFSEPRAGIWEFVRGVVRDESAPWMWVNVVTSVASTLCLGWFMSTRLANWRQGTLERGDQLVLIFLAVLIGNAAISFGYTRDVIMSTAGVLYALALYPTMMAATGRLVFPIGRRFLLGVILCVMSLGWSMRYAGTTYLLRETAFDKRNEWADGIQVLEQRRQLPADHRRAFVLQLRRDALERQVPRPILSQPWLRRWAGAN